MTLKNILQPDNVVDVMSEVIQLYAAMVPQVCVVFVFLHSCLDQLILQLEMSNLDNVLPNILNSIDSYSTNPDILPGILELLDNLAWYAFMVLISRPITLISSVELTGRSADFAKRILSNLVVIHDPLQQAFPDLLGYIRIYRSYYTYVTLLKVKKKKEKKE